MRFSSIAFATFLLSSSLPLVAQRVYTKEDYTQAERWMSYNVSGLVHHTVAGVTYLPDGRIFYRDPGPNGTAYMIAAPGSTGWSTAPAFDNAKLAAALSGAGKDKANPSKLGISEYAVEPSGFVVTTHAGKFHCNATATKCTPEPEPPSEETTPEKPGATAAATKAAKPAAKAPGRRKAGAENLSPDKKLAAFIRDNNLWVKTVATGAEKQLTTDGILDFGYATDNAGWQHSDAAILTWSADGKKIATFQQDQRKTGFMYLVPTTNRHPDLEAWRYPLVGDKDVTMIEPVIIDVATATVVRLKTPPLEHRSMECDDVSCDGDGRWNDVDFSPDDTKLAFVKTSRDHKDENVVMADTATGAVKEIYHEHVPTYYGWQAQTDWKVLWNSDEFLWVSERSNWAQAYLYDLTTGKLKGEVTHGDGPIQYISFVDQKARILYFLATAKEPGDPYQRKLYSVGLDGRNQTLLTPEALDHNVTMAPDGKTFVDVYSSVDVPQTAVVRDPSGKVLLMLAKEDISELTAKGWKPPTRFTVKARDGKTDLWGNIWKPTNFSAARKYPLVDYVYPGPQDGSCSVGGPAWFRASRGDDDQSLADLGFIVICLDGMGNPHRSKSFHDAHASRPEDMGDDTIPDQVAGIKQLAKENSWIDVDHVGIWGHSGGGNATVSAMFHFPDFFKVGWAESGNHDNRDYEDDWDERWAGLEVIGPDGKSNYDAHANQNYAANLKGKLMLTQGTMDDNVPPNNTLLVVEALMKANKDFDLLMIPNARHGYGEANPYVMRRRWDYFVKNLAGGVPALDFEPKSYAEIVKAYYANQ
jgi:dipeptidyl-peptidase-4